MSGEPMTQAKLDRIRRDLGENDSRCRLCGFQQVDRHHIVPRSLKRCDDEDNLIPLCRLCHDQVHAKRVDLMSVLTLEEQGKAASLIGLEAAHRLLAPSVYRVAA